MTPFGSTGVAWFVVKALAPCRETGVEDAVVVGVVVVVKDVATSTGDWVVVGVYHRWVVLLAAH
jgi:hypothetical protein